MDKPEPRPTGSQWDIYAEQIRVQLPAAPEELLNGYVRWMPWVAIIFGVLELVLFVVDGVFAGSALLSIATYAVLAALDIGGGYMMLQHRLTGWWILAVGIVLTVMNNVLLSPLPLAILGLVLGLAVAYVHLLVKPRYIAG